MSEPIDPLAPAEIPIDDAVVASSAVVPREAIDLVALRERVLTTMRKRHTVEGQFAWLLVAAGLAILLVAGFVLSTAMTLLTYIVFEDAGIGFKGWFVVYLLAITALLIVEARRTRNGFFTFAAGDVDLRRDPDSLGDFVIHRSRTHAATIVEMILWGPRALLAGCRALAGVPQTGLELVLPEAADVLTLMLSLETGVKIKELAAPGADPMGLMPVLKWLDTHDYIGISSRGDRVWVSSVAKKLFL